MSVAQLALETSEAVRLGGDGAYASISSLMARLEYVSPNGSVVSLGPPVD